MRILHATKLIKTESQILTREFVATHLNKYARSPEMDCFIASARPKNAYQRINPETNNGLRRYLQAQKDPSGTRIFEKSKDIKEILSSAKTSEERKAKAAAVLFLKEHVKQYIAPRRNNFRWLEKYSIETILTHVSSMDDVEYVKKLLAINGDISSNTGYLLRDAKSHNLSKEVLNLLKVENTDFDDVQTLIMSLGFDKGKIKQAEELANTGLFKYENYDYDSKPLNTICDIINGSHSDVRIKAAKILVQSDNIDKLNQHQIKKFIEKTDPQLVLFNAIQFKKLSKLPRMAESDNLRVLQEIMSGTVDSKDALMHKIAIIKLIPQIIKKADIPSDSINSQENVKYFIKTGVDKALNIARFTNTAEQAKAKLYILRELMDLQKLGVYDLAISLVNTTSDMSDAVAKIDFVKEFFSKFNGTVGNAIVTAKSVKTKSDIPLKINLIKKLIEEKNIPIDEASTFAMKVKNPQDCVLLEKLLAQNTDFCVICDAIVSSNPVWKKILLADNKTFMSKIESLKELPEEVRLKFKDNNELLQNHQEHYSTLANSLQLKVFQDNIEEEHLNPQRIKNLFEFLNKNKILLQRNGETQVTTENILSLFDDKLMPAMQLVDNSVFKYAAKLKLDGFQDFVSNIVNLMDRLNSMAINNVNPKPIDILKTQLSGQTRTENKFEILQTLIALNSNWSSYIPQGNYNHSEFLRIINLIKPTQVTPEQTQIAKEIFSSTQPYNSQVNEFINKLNINESKHKPVREFFDKLKLETKIYQIEQEIHNISANQKIPQDKKRLLLDKLTETKAQIINNPNLVENLTLTPKIINQITQQIEVHSNLSQALNEFHQAAKKELFDILNINLSDELASKLDFSPEYISNLAFAMKSSNSHINVTDFKGQFLKFIELLDSNPQLPLSKLRETLPHNIQTKQLFAENKLIYSKWKSYDENLVLPFTLAIKEADAIRGVELNLINEFRSELFNSVDSTETNKIIQALNTAQFQINNDSITKNGTPITKTDLKQIVEMIAKTIEDNSDFWDKKLFDEVKQNNKQELLDHLLKGRKKEVDDLLRMKDAIIDLSLRLSDDDNISRNLFIGNHVGCCTAVDGTNGHAAPQHLMNSFIRAMEIVDKGGNSYGNSMCYFAKVDGKLSFIIDSFEASGKLGGNKVVTDKIIEFAKQVTKEMGQSDLPIYLGPVYNKISMEGLVETSNHSIQAIGRISDKTYVDSLGGSVRDASRISQYKKLYELN